MPQDISDNLLLHAPPRLKPILSNMLDGAKTQESIGSLRVTSDRASVVVHKPWVSETDAASLGAALARQPGAVAAIGGFRLRNGTILSGGDFLLHPKGLHFRLRGAPAAAARFGCECDCIADGAVAIRRGAFDVTQGRTLLAGDFEDLTMTALTLGIRRALGASVRIVTLPDLLLDQQDPELSISSHARNAFSREFNLDPLAAELSALHDIEFAWARWNASLWGRPGDFSKYTERGAYHWTSYASHAPFKQRADSIAQLLLSTLAKGAVKGPILDVGAGDGLFSWLLAQSEYPVEGIEREPNAVAAANAELQSRNARAHVKLGDAEALDAPDGSFAAALLADVIEHLGSPVKALREIRRVLKPGGILLVVTPSWRFGSSPDPVHHLEEYRMDELLRQLGACGFSVRESGAIKGQYDDLVAVATR